MFKTYFTQPNDTFEIIARKEYGDELEAGRIASANPGVIEPMTAGLFINIPPIPEAATNQAQKAAGEVNEVSILIEGIRYRFWAEVRITRAIDNIDTVEFSAPSNFESKTFRKTFQPFDYKTVNINVSGKVLFTGTMVSVVPVLANDEKTLQIACYSLPGILNDCTPPASDYPLEFIRQTLKEIAVKLCKPFGIGVLFHVEPGAKFKQEAMATGTTVLSFLTKLAKERNIIISSTPKGQLLFQQSIPAGKPVAKFRQGESPLFSVTPLFNAQAYFSHITGIESTTTGSHGSQFTVKNPRLNGVNRPHTFSIKSAEGGEIKQTVEAKAGRMFGNMVSYAVNVPTWLDPKGELWQPNTTVTLHAHDAMIYSDYEFIIRNVEFARDSSGEIATLNLVLPGSFEGKQPGSLPWDA